MKAHPSKVPSSWIRGRCWERMFCCEMEPRKGRYFSMRHSEGCRGEVAEVGFPQAVPPSPQRLGHLAILTLGGPTYLSPTLPEEHT